MRLAERRRLAGRLHVEDEVDVSLRVTPYILRLVVAEVSEAERREQAGKRVRIGPGELDEFKAVEADRVFVRSHGGLLGLVSYETICGGGLLSIC
jgi:hypothetical protein